jgi:radical SAM modification target selenobiotic family peptide
VKIVVKTVFSCFLQWEENISEQRRVTMDIKELKKVLAGIGVVGLLAGGGVSVPGSVGASSG